MMKTGVEGGSTVNTDSLFNLFADALLMIHPKVSWGPTESIRFRPFLRSFASNITANLARTVSGLSFAVPVSKCGGKA